MRGAVPALLVLLASAHPAQAKDQQSELMAAGERWNALYAAGDWDSLRAFYTEDAWRMSDRSPAEKGVEAIIANLRSFRDMGASVSFRYEPEDIRIDGRIATVISRYWMAAHLPGRPAVRTAGRSVRLFRRVSGHWRMWREMDNTTPDVKAEPAP